MKLDHGETGISCRRLALATTATLAGVALAACGTSGAQPAPPRRRRFVGTPSRDDHGATTTAPLNDDDDTTTGHHRAGDTGRARSVDLAPLRLLAPVFVPAR